MGRHVPAGALCDRRRHAAYTAACRTGDPQRYRNELAAQLPVAVLTVPGPYQPLRARANTSLAQPLAVTARAAGLGLELDRQHEAAAADFAHGRAADARELRQEARALAFGVRDHAFFDEHPERGARDRAGKRVAAEGAAVLSRLQDAEDIGVREHRGDRVVAARERLADQRDVRLDALVLLRQE